MSLIFSYFQVFEVITKPVASSVFAEVVLSLERFDNFYGKAGNSLLCNMAQLINLDDGDIYTIPILIPQGIRNHSKAGILLTKTHKSTDTERFLGLCHLSWVETKFDLKEDMFHD